MSYEADLARAQAAESTENKAADVPEARAEVSQKRQEFVKLGKTGEQMVVETEPYTGAGASNEQIKVTMRLAGEDFDSNRDRVFVAKNGDNAAAVLEDVQGRAEKFNGNMKEFLADLRKTNTMDWLTMESSASAAVRE